MEREPAGSRRSPALTNVGGAIRRARRAYGLTQQQLAELAGTSERTVREVEAGSPSPSIGTVIALAEAVGVHLGEVEP